MSAPITEAHRALAEKLGDLLDIEQMTGPSPAEQAAQLIADSEAAAVQIAMIREYGNLCATNEGLAKERDQLRADCENETKWAAHYLADAQNARARAERAEAELAAERARLDDLLSINATGAARLAHATVQLKAEREKSERYRLAALKQDAALSTEREKVRALRLACERIVAQWDADHDTNPIGAGGLMYTRASFALAATEDAQ
jgi:hypothetical protein